MSADKNKLHDRAMKLLHDEIRAGRGYCCSGGIGPSDELTYLIDKKLVTIDRSGFYGSNGKHSTVKPVETKS